MTSIPNDDVLYEICRVCPASTLLKLCLVSTTFYTTAMPNLLEDVMLRRSPEMLLRFLHFILDNPTAVSEIPGQAAVRVQRFSIADPGTCVYAFQLYRSGIEEPESDDPSPTASRSIEIEEWAPLLTKAILLMPNLRSVIIHSSFNMICRRSSQFAEAILSRPQLTTLIVDQFRSTGSKAIGEAVRSMQGNAWKLKHIGFREWYSLDDWVPSALLKNEGFGSLIYSCRNTLERLTLAGCNMKNLLISTQELRDGSSGGSMKPIVYPHVEMISVLENTGVTVEEFGSSFPSLRTLRLGDCYAFDLPDDGMDRKASFRNLISVFTDDFRVLSSFLQNAEPPPILQHLQVTLPHPGGVGDNVSAHPVLTEVFHNLQSLDVSLEGMPVLGPWKDMCRLLTSLHYLHLDYNFEPGNQDQTLDIISPEPLRLIPLEHVYISFSVRADLEIKDPISEDAVALLYARSIKSLKFIGVCKKSRKHRDIYNWLEPGETHRWRVVRMESPADGIESIKLEALEEQPLPL